MTHGVGFGQVLQANQYFERAVQCYEVASDLDERARTSYLLGTSLQRIGRIEDARNAFASAAANTRDDTAPHWRLGLVQLDLGAMEAAEAAFQDARKIDPADDRGLIGLARVALQRGENERAVELLEDAHALRTANTGYINRLLSTAYWRVGRRNDAERTLRLADDVVPRWPDAWLAELQQYRVSFQSQLAHAQRLISGLRVNDGVHILERLRTDHPTDPDLLTLLAVGYAALAQIDEAIAAVDQAAIAHPHNAAVQRTLGNALLRKAREVARLEARQYRERARSHLERAVELDPTDAVALATLGDLHLAEGRASSALESYTTAYHADPDNVERPYAVAKVLAQMERWGEAVAFMERTVAIDPNSGRAIHMLGVVQTRMLKYDAAERSLTQARELLGDTDGVMTAIRELERRRRE